ncbi:MAG: PTS system mannose-specific EIIAB component [Candidatus Celerinatantimonas neptuna]|nr:MAG: PTS system mannose-specific EIIAB component [Candidatus Celerinatantimonas neptuna]
MSIAIIIGTHGAAAEPLLRNAEMLIGDQDNVAFIEFKPGENADTLVEKYKKCLMDLETDKGVLFLVDTWGGSPFNAATRLATEQKDYEVITGVNVPMLTETFMTRDDDPSLDELISIALEAGSGGVKAFKTKQQKPALKPVQSNTPVASTPAGAGGHMSIGLARIDDRLIHGQVATRWTKETGVNRIIVVSDEVAQDQVRSTLLKQVAPPGVTAHVVDVAKAIRVYDNPKYARDKVMLLFTNPTDVLTLVQGGVDIKSVNVGGMAFRQGKTQVNNAVSVDQQDIESFKTLNKLGIELEVRKVATDSRLMMMDLIKKIA